jgi:hypothetical protein
MNRRRRGFNNRLVVALEMGPPLLCPKNHRHQIAPTLQDVLSTLTLTPPPPPPQTTPVTVRMEIVIAVVVVVVAAACPPLRITCLRSSTKKHK